MRDPESGWETGDDAGNAMLMTLLEIIGGLYERWPGNRKGFFSRLFT